MMNLRILDQDPDRKTEPQEPIRRITESFPNDERSPFYDPDGKPMKPVARLSIARQRLYEKSCAGVGQGDGERGRLIYNVSLFGTQHFHHLCVRPSVA